MELSTLFGKWLRKWNKPSKEARKIVVPADQVDALLSLREEYYAKTSMKNQLKLDKFAHQICPELEAWNGADWEMYVSGGKLFIVEDV